MYVECVCVRERESILYAIHEGFIVRWMDRY